MEETKEFKMETTEKFDMETVLKNLKKKVGEELKKTFCLKAEFQSELALMIKDICKDIEKTYLEFLFKINEDTDEENINNRRHLDILVIFKGNTVIPKV